MAAKASWLIRVEYVNDDGAFGEGRPRRLSLEITGDWELNCGQRSVDQCVAIDMASLMRMLQRSGELVNPSDHEEVAFAFTDAMDPRS